jgi:hypothetical protein
LIINNGCLLSINSSDIQDGHFIVPANVTHIGEQAFGGFTGLTSVTLPAGLTTIGDRAFSGCTGLTNIFLPSGITKIGTRAFHGCTGLTNIVLPTGVTKIGPMAFGGCTGLTTVSLQAGLTEIGSSLFAGCIRLSSITLPTGLTSIGFGALGGCTNLAMIILDSDDAAELKKLRYTLRGNLNTKIISKSQHIQQIQQTKLQFALGVAQKGNILNRFFSPEAREQSDNIFDPNVLNEVYEFLW